MRNKTPFRYLVAGMLTLVAVVACGGDSVTSKPLSAPTVAANTDSAATTLPTQSAEPTPTSVPQVVPTLVAGEWTRLEPRSGRRTNFHATLLGDGRILIFGGAGNEGLAVNSEIFDPITNSWSNSGDLTYPIIARTPPVLLADGRILVMDPSREGPTSRTQVFDPESGEWTATEPLNVQRWTSASAALPDGGAMVIGGADQEDIPMTSVERFDPETNAWSLQTDSPLPQRWCVHATVPLSDGKVAVVGEGTALSDRAAVYDSVADEWTETAPMNIARRCASKWRLEGDGLLVVGGFTGADSTLESEIYDPVADEWMIAADAPSAMIRIGSLADGRAAGLGFDGTFSQFALFIYDPGTDTWDTLPAPFVIDDNSAIIPVVLGNDDQVYAFTEGDDFFGILPETWAIKVPPK